MITKRRTAMVVALSILAAWVTGSLRSVDGPVAATPAIDHAVRTESAAAPVVVTGTGAKKAVQGSWSVHGRRFDLGDRTVAAFLDRMAPLARKSDADVAYRVYQAEALCGSVDGERKWMRESTVYDVDAMEDWKRSVERIAVVCEGVTPAQMQERFGFLDQAIRAGNHEAMLDYRSEGPLGFDIPSLDPRDSRLIEWELRSNAYLELLAAQGDREAWGRLTGDYRSGRYVPQDYGAAIKYRVALVSSGTQSDRDPMTLGDVADMARTMNPVDVQSAIDQGRSLGKQFPMRRR